MKLSNVTTQYALDHIVGRHVTAVTATDSTITFTLNNGTTHTLCSWSDPDDFDYLAFSGQPRTCWFTELSRCIEGLLTMVRESTAELLNRGVLYEPSSDPNTGLMTIQPYNQQVTYRTAVHNCLLYTGALPGEVSLLNLESFL